MSLWLKIVITILLIAGLFLRFAVRGYSAIAYTCFYLIALILILSYAPCGLKVAILVLTAILVAAVVVAEIPVMREAERTATNDEDYCIVLGAKVNDGEPSLQLLYRLQAAEKYLKGNPHAIAVVTGGQGANEDISEALCMRNWLVEHGIQDERIIMEDQATDTRENLKFSMALVNEREASLGKDAKTPPTITLVSSEYHLYRAKGIAERQGIEVTTVPSYCGWPLIKANYYLREAFAVWLYWVQGIFGR